MKQALTTLTISTPGAGIHDITDRVAAWVSRQGVGQGLLTLFLRHTSASLVIQENADPAVRHDLETFFRRLVPEEAGLYRHQEEGLDDMPAHIKAALTSTHLAIPVEEGRLCLGVWQGIYLFEHRHRPHDRHLTLHLLGE